MQQLNFTYLPFFFLCGLFLQNTWQVVGLKVNPGCEEVFYSVTMEL